MAPFHIPDHFTAQQRAFLEAVLHTQHHLFLKATAGAGKITTLTTAAHALKARGVYFAYNKHAVADLATRLPSRVRARTLHAHGLGLLHQISPNVIDLNDDKARQVAQIALRDRAISPLYITVRARTASTIWSLVSVAGSGKLLLAGRNRGAMVAGSLKFRPPVVRRPSSFAAQFSGKIRRS